MVHNTHLKTKASLFLAAAFLCVTTLFMSCQSEQEMITYPNNNNDNEKALISGQVIDQATGFPIDSALVRIFGNKLNEILYTAADGQFSIEGEVDLKEDILVLTL